MAPSPAHTPTPPPPPPPPPSSPTKNGVSAEAGYQGQRTPVEGNSSKLSLQSGDALKVIDRHSHSFFFTGFTEEWQSSAMWRYFKRFGTVVDVYVPQK